MAYVITLTGPSMCGKSRVIKQIEKISNLKKYRDNFSVVKVPKYTTRPFRENEIMAIVEGNCDEIDVLPVIGKYNENPDLSPQELQDAKFDAFKKLGCDLVYEQYGFRYGIRLSDLYEYIRIGKSPLVILNDVRAIEDIKALFGKQCISLFIFREAPDYEHFKSEGERRHDTPESIWNRYEKATAIYRIYIENIATFDKLILNVRNGNNSIRKILDHLISSMSKEPECFV